MNTPPPAVAASACTRATGGVGAGVARGVWDDAGIVGLRRRAGESVAAGWVEGSKGMAGRRVFKSKTLHVCPRGHDAREAAIRLATGRG